MDIHTFLNLRILNIHQEFIKDLLGLDKHINFNYFLLFIINNNLI